MLSNLYFLIEGKKSWGLGLGDSGEEEDVSWVSPVSELTGSPRPVCGIWLGCMQLSAVFLSKSKQVILLNLLTAGV